MQRTTRKVAASIDASASNSRLSLTGAAEHERACRYRAMLDGLTFVAYLYMVSNDGIATPAPYASPSVKDLTGYTPDSFLSRQGFDDAVFEPDKLIARRLHATGGSAEYRIVCANGDLKWVADTCESSGRSPRTVRGTLTEIHPRVKEGVSAAGWRGSEIAALLERVPVAFYLDRFDPANGHCMRVYTSPQIFDMTGHTPDEISADATLWRSLIDPRDVVDADALKYPAAYTPGETLRSEYRMHARDGRVTWVRDEATVSSAEGDGLTYLYGVIHDITHEHEIDTQNKFSTQHDELTGLLNRAMLRGALVNAIEETIRSGRGFSLLFMDIDEFKEINDSLGHEFGDRVLVAVARRLQSSLRDGDVVARLGGDEFAVILHGASSENALVVANDIAETLEAPLLLDGCPVTVSCSIGVAAYPEHGATTDVDLMRIADVAMYSAKHNHSRVAVFKKGLEDVAANAGFSHLGELYSGIERHEFVLFYQPWLSAKRGKITACEALIRWKHPVRGLLAPGEFLPLAEKAGLIRNLDLIALDIACAQAAEWRDADLGIRVAINASRASLLDDGFSAAVAGALQRYHLNGSEIEIEITENGVLGDPDQAAFFAKRLEALGISLSIDDFGTGYSSLAQFSRMKVSTLKIDQSFVRDMLTDDVDARIVKSVLALGHESNQEVVAEGVEDKETLRVLCEMGVDYIQGYVIAKPMPPDVFVTWLAERRASSAGGATLKVATA